jgi:hypothetical protein
MDAMIEVSIALVWLTLRTAIALIFRTLPDDVTPRETRVSLRSTGNGHGDTRGTETAR